MSSPNKVQSINLVAAALGGEGGGVFTNWVIDVADANGWICQSTSLAGVAQRTGATIYYIELFPRSGMAERAPIMSLFPAPGDIDITITSEIAEAGRMVARGFVSKERTTLITSTHRVYGITEKTQLGDGSIDADTLVEVAARYAKELIHYDMDALAKEHGALISSVMLGALAASGALPFSKDSFQQVIRNTGKLVEINLAAFNASFVRAQSLDVGIFEPQVSLANVGSPASGDAEAFTFPEAQTAAGRDLLVRAQHLPESTHEIIYHAFTKLIDYQDIRYAEQYLDKLEKTYVLDSGAENYRLTQSLARYLALWMCYEDIPRVAQLKTRAGRMDSIREEVLAQDEQILYVAEFFRPRVEEICAMLPPSVAKLFLNNRFIYKFIDFFTGGRQLRTNTISIFAVLSVLGRLRKFRRYSAGYAHEHKMINSWLDAVNLLAKSDLAAAQEMADCGRLIKGYGETRYRTSSQLAAIVSKAESSPAAQEIAELYEAAFADDENKAFKKTLNAAH